MVLNDVSQRSVRREQDARLTVGFVLVQRFTLCAFANFVDVLRLAADEGDRSRPIQCRWKVVAPDMRPITASCGVSVQPHEVFGSPKHFDYIVVVGGLIDEMDRPDERVERYLRQAAAAGVPLVGLCTGTFILHRAGLMEGYRGCVSWFHHQDFLSQFDGLRPISDQIFVVDRDRLTCSGGTSTAHLAAFLVDRHIGKAQSTKSLNIMMISEAEDGGAPQPGLTLSFRTKDPIVRKALLLMQQSLDTPVSVSEMARHLKVGKRCLERHFREALGTSPLTAFIEMRLLLARHMLENTDKSIAMIAAESGFCDSSHLSRTFRRRFANTPQNFRASLGS
ncbi:GlxA family transcriptional regulator [Sinorhizobium mexicanum]|uniref:GlxA family transcriptional regulator n=1 Tax=Sinorhizobium mexicanum TaxID=375549 RepID=A0A859QG66_9HYPH|nr:GlxA family transcriptional regulator [Sinorhizobium mexicanum]MBP1883763.1 transcriptional regulator GlxA family with amidase domain [Sinorhizobium mexicanum]QLL62934.1 GlxA family transcriptional regulator [Sinorhizobium mexicanum]